jgi:hypothetical protein
MKTHILELVDQKTKPQFRISISHLEEDLLRPVLMIGNYLLFNKWD